MQRQFPVRLLAIPTLLAFILSSGFTQTPGKQSPPQNSTIDAAARAAVIEGALKALNENYVFPETARQMEQAIRERQQSKEYDAITDPDGFAQKLTDHLREICRDKHLRVVYSAQPLPQRDRPQPETAEERAQARAFAAARNFGFEKVERLSGNIGYLDLRGFMNAELASETATAAMGFLAHTDALIIDLRQNGGGDPAMVAFLSSYLFDQRTHLNDIYHRPTNKTEEFWTRTDVPGKRYGNKPVYLLTSRRTFSAAEEFSYNLKNLKRATVIGETTGGGAHPVNFHRLNDHFGIGVPFARAINPITKTNWEGTGVQPDVETPAAQALKKAHLAALKDVLGKTTDPRRVEQLKSVIDSIQRELNVPTSKATAASQGEQMIALPETPVGKTFGEFIKAFNTGDLETLKRFHRAHGGDEENAEQDLGFFQQSGGLKLHSVKSPSQFEIEALAQTKKDGGWVNFSMTVESQPPHGVSDIGIRPGAAPPDEKSAPASPAQPKAKPNEPASLQDVGKLIDQNLTDDSFSGVVLIAKENKPVFQKVGGLANRQEKIPNRIDTKFNLGSINKTFTRIAVTQLIEAGKLSLSDRLGKFLPDYPNKDAAAKVTIEHLLGMQSGIGDFFGSKFDATPKTQLRSIKDFLPLFADRPLAFEPGSRRAYSNGGYVVLGAIIEKVTGQSYYDYVRERIFKPAGMINTDSFESDFKTPNLAEGYTRRGETSGELAGNIKTRPARGSSAGGGYSTAEDLLKFTIALQNNKLLSPEFTRWILAGEKPAKLSTSDSERKARGRGGLGIAGGAPGINAVLEFDLDSGYTVIVLSNYDPPSAEKISEQIRGLIPRIKE